MTGLFYLAAAVAVIATALVVTRANAVHALLYLIVSLLAVAVVFYALGAPFAAALEVIIYAGAIMVLFVFVVMMLNLGPEAAGQERRWMSPGIWVGPALLSAVLIGELLYLLVSGALGAPNHAAAAIPGGAMRAAIEPRQVGMLLFGPYLLAVELGSMLLLAGLVGAYHLGRERAAEHG
ncbi:MAG TPA: NADH-quinone oxidoreductase subunit J [Steroidobacteraceae bacterium]|jgi:NADH-quinone oxidoreductase subunit J|nr:NADH-quinone oxidoreductase subunit J [Steroidobacteraceae bacterium]